VVHGELDSIVLAEESRQFVEALRSAGADAGFYEVLGAQHGFDAISSLRSRAVARMCIAWLEGLVAELEGQGTRGA
jgi:dipeptidyl aminopeptidase/acylaminoacyl peptidase